MDDLVRRGWGFLWKTKIGRALEILLKESEKTAERRTTIL